MVKLLNNMMLAENTKFAYRKDTNSAAFIHISVATGKKINLKHLRSKSVPSL